MAEESLLLSKYSDILPLLDQFDRLDIGQQIDFDKYYLYSLITHSTAIEGSTVTEIENQLLFDQGLSAPGRSMVEQLMNLDLRNAYLQARQHAERHTPFSIDMLCQLSSLVMKNTGGMYSVALGNFDSSKGDLRLVNVSAGATGSSYLSYQKVPSHLAAFCQWVNDERMRRFDSLEAYAFSFRAHYRLVSIHPWVDGNGRMSRLVMNLLQWEQGLLPTIVSSDHKVAYIESLAQSRERDDEAPFLDFIFGELRSYLQQSIATYQRDTDVQKDVQKKLTDRQQDILRFIAEDPSITQEEMSRKLQCSVKTLQREFATLGITRQGGRKVGLWEVAKR